MGWPFVRLLLRTRVEVFWPGENWKRPQYNVAAAPLLPPYVAFQPCTPQLSKHAATHAGSTHAAVDDACGNTRARGRLMTTVVRRERTGSGAIIAWSGPESCSTGAWRFGCFGGSSANDWTVLLNGS